MWEIGNGGSFQWAPESTLDVNLLYALSLCGALHMEHLFENQTESKASHTIHAIVGRLIVFRGSELTPLSFSLSSERLIYYSLNLAVLEAPLEHDVLLYPREFFSCLRGSDKNIYIYNQLVDRSQRWLTCACVVCGVCL